MGEKRKYRRYTLTEFVAVLDPFRGGNSIGLIIAIGDFQCKSTRVHKIYQFSGCLIEAGIDTEEENDLENVRKEDNPMETNGAAMRWVRVYRQYVRSCERGQDGSGGIQADPSANRDSHR